MVKKRKKVTKKEKKYIIVIIVLSILASYFTCPMDGVHHMVWSYEDTCKFDVENDTNYARDWCQEARNHGYIYLVDFAGFGNLDK